MQGTPTVSVVMFAGAALLGAVGQFLYQAGAKAATPSVAGYLLNLRLWAGVLCYVAVMGLFVGAFKVGGRLTVLYPVYASTFVWAAVLAWWWQGQAIKPVHVAGMLTLVLGMYLMGRS